MYRIRFSLRTVAVAGVMFVCAICAIAFSEEKKSVGGAGGRLQAIAWIAGHWQTEIKGDLLEEYWMPPAGDCMIGTFRWIKDGKLWMFEVLSITAEGDGIVLRIKHFDSKMIGWEEKEKALHWKLTKSDANQAIFENAEQKSATKFTFRRDGDSGLGVSLEGEKDGKPTTREFTYRRVAG